MRLNKLVGFRKRLAVVLVVLLIPSAAMANEAPDPDEVLSVTVDLPADGGDQGSAGCSGYSSMNLSANSLEATLDQITPGISNPTLAQRLDLYGLAVNSTDDSADNNPLFTLQEGLGPGGSDRLSISSVVQDYLKEKLDTNGDGFIDSSDRTLLALDRRIFVTDEFRVNFRASTCVDSSYLGMVMAGRSDLQMASFDDGDRVWVSIDVDTGYPLGFAVPDSFVGDSYLRANINLLGDILTIPRRVLLDPEGSEQPIVLGSEGERPFKAVTRLFGEGDSGQFRTQYSFWLIVSDENGFFPVDIIDGDVTDFFFGGDLCLGDGGLGSCGP